MFKTVKEWKDSVLKPLEREVETWRYKNGRCYPRENGKFIWEVQEDKMYYGDKDGMFFRLTHSCCQEGDYMQIHFNITGAHDSRIGFSLDHPNVVRARQINKMVITSPYPTEKIYGTDIYFFMHEKLEKKIKDDGHKIIPYYKTCAENSALSEKEREYARLMLQIFEMTEK